MLATLVALHLALAQGSPAAEPAPAAPAKEAEGVAPAPRAAEPSAEPAEPGKGERPAAAPAPEEEEGLKSTRELPPPTIMKARRQPKTALTAIPSMQTAEPLGGRSAVVVWGGWSSIGAGWAQGVSPEDDLGLLGDIDWSTGELRVSGWYRRPLGHVGLFDIGSRLRAGWWADLGATWAHDDNQKDRGVEFVPGLVASIRGAGGVFAVAGDLPIVVTLWRDGGIFAAPKLSLSYETLLYGDLTVGVRVAGSYRAGAGDAPMSDPHALLDLQVMAGWRLF
jgi:hypothetical protein